MQAGKLRHRVIIQAKTTTPDAVNQPIASWTEFATVWGRVEPLSGRELVAAKEVMAEVSHRVTIRYRTGVNSVHRVKFKARYFAILAVLNEEERNRDLGLLCRELVGREIE